MVYLRHRHSEGESWTTSAGTALIQVKPIGSVPVRNVLQIEDHIFHLTCGPDSMERLDRVKRYYHIDSTEDLIAHMTVSQVEGACYTDPFYEDLPLHV